MCCDYRFYQQKVPFEKRFLAESMTHVVDLGRSRESPEAHRTLPDDTGASNNLEVITLDLWSNQKAKKTRCSRQ